ncbi:MAG: pyridoxal phosphate-dependent aminotransferase [Fidelibacterota bacterium]
MRIADRITNLGTETAFAVSGQAREWAEKGNKVYPFHLGDMNLPTPDNIVEAANKYIRERYNGYAPPNGILPLREALAEDVGNKRGVKYSPDNVSIQPGGKPTIGKFIQAIMNPGDEVLYPNPGYPIYESQIEYHGGTAVPYQYEQTETGFAIDIDRLKSSISDKTTALIYNNYNNPISAESSRTEMEALAELAIKNDLWVLSDDAYYEILYDTQAQSIVNIPGMQERTVILYTFSKKFAMTGWRLGAAIGPTDVINVINKLNVNDESCTNHFHQWAMIEALGENQSGAKSILNTLRKRRDAAVHGLNEINGIDITTPECTFYLFPNVTKIMERKQLKGLSELQLGALHDTGVSFCTREHFGRIQSGETEFYIRLAYSGITVDEINEGLGKLKIFFEA